MNRFPKLNAGDMVSLAGQPGKWIVRTIVKDSKADLQNAHDFGSIITSSISDLTVIARSGSPNCPY
jgi:hypothetical protein